MYSLSIHFGPNAMVWAFLFKEKEKGDACFELAMTNAYADSATAITDDFGQRAVFGPGTITGMMIEDLDLVEEARILRSLANARGEVKARQRATTDPVIRAGAQGPSVLQPRFNG